jgi:hypothetical protein
MINLTARRFIEPGKRGGGLDLNSQPVNDFIAFLKEHHTVLDPTMAAWEDTYLDRPGEIAKSDSDVSSFAGAGTALIEDWRRRARRR